MFYLFFLNEFKSSKLSFFLSNSSFHFGLLSLFYLLGSLKLVILLFCESLNLGLYMQLLDFDDLSGLLQLFLQS